MPSTTLWLPIPDGANNEASHHMERYKAKNRYRRKAWVRACHQQKPPRDPPGMVAVSAALHSRNAWDDDNRAAALKWVLDALKQKQTGDVGWRCGLYTRCGFFVDDDPGHLHLVGIPEQVTGVVERERRLELTVMWREPDAQD